MSSHEQKTILNLLKEDCIWKGYEDREFIHQRPGGKYQIP